MIRPTIWKPIFTIRNATFVLLINIIVNNNNNNSYYCYYHAITFLVIKAKKGPSVILNTLYIFLLYENTKCSIEYNWPILLK